MKKILPVILLMCTALTYAQNRNIAKLTNKTYQAGIFTNVFRFEKMLRSGDGSDDGWGWAACITMVLNYSGLNVTQEQIYRAGPRNQDNEQSITQDIMASMNRTTPEAWGRPSHIFNDPVNIDHELIFDELAANRPLIVAMHTINGEGKANVLTAMSYTIQYNAAGEQTGIVPATVTLRDPWPAAPSQTVLTWADFVNNAASLYTVKVVYKARIDK